MIKDHRSAAAEVLHARRSRNAVFCAYLDGFGEPAWDTLLLLFVAGDRLPAEQLIEQISAPQGSTKLYLRWLATQDLVAIDGELVGLTARGNGLMSEYLEKENRHA